MLKLFFGYDRNAILNVDTFFNNTYEEEWIIDPFVSKIIKSVDGSQVKDKVCIISPVLGQIPPEKLSGGVKALILMDKYDDFYTDLIVFGSNCEDFILEIAQKKDICASLSGYDISFKNLGNKYKVPIECANDNTLLYTHEDFIQKMLSFSFSGAKK